MNFWRFIKAALRFQKAMRSVAEANEQDFWTEADAKFLTNFLQSYTGKKLQLRLTNYAFKSALSAVRQKGSEAYECGEAAGIQLGIAALQEHTLSQVAAHSDKSEEHIDDVMGDLEPDTSYG